MWGYFRALTLIGAAMVAAPALAKAPDPAACPRPVAADGGERQRTRPLPVPAALAGVLRASVLHYAVTARDGSTLCIDTSWMESADKIAISIIRNIIRDNTAPIGIIRQDDSARVQLLLNRGIFNFAAQVTQTGLIYLGL